MLHDDVPPLDGDQCNTVLLSQLTIQKRLSIKNRPPANFHGCDFNIGNIFQDIEFSTIVLLPENTIIVFSMELIL